MNKYLRIVLSGLAAGFVGEGIMGALFMSPPIQSVLYDPALQSDLYIKITPERNLFITLTGMIILSIAHAWFYSIFLRSMPGKTWIGKGLFWGFTIWLLYWVFQEWFVYHTLINEPLVLNLLELVILLIGSLAEGVIIGWFFKHELASDYGKTAVSS